MDIFKFHVTYNICSKFTHLFKFTVKYLDKKTYFDFLHKLGLRRCINKVYVAPQVHLTSFMFSVGETVKDLKLHLPTVVKLSRCFTSTNWHTCIPNLHRQPIFQSNSNFRINSNSRVFI